MLFRSMPCKRADTKVDFPSTRDFTTTPFVFELTTVYKPGIPFIAITSLKVILKICVSQSKYSECSNDLLSAKKIHAATSYSTVEGKEIELTLKEGQAIIINNKNIRHARKGPVGDRLLLRIWIEEVK